MTVQPFEVNPARVEAAIRVYQEKAANLTDPELQILCIAMELGFYHLTCYDEDGMIQMDLTDLQWVAMAAAVAAVAEVGGYHISNPNIRNRIHFRAEKIQYSELANVPAQGTA